MTTSAPLTIGIHTDGEEAEARDLGDLLTDAGFRARVFDSSRPVARQREILARHDMLVFLRPEGQPARQTIGMAAGLGRPVAVLVSSGGGRHDALPDGVKTVQSMRLLIAHIRRSAVRLGRREQKIGHDMLRQYGACAEGVDWFRTQYPKGRRLSEWSPQVQRDMLLSGGGPWIEAGTRYGWVAFFPMEGEDFSGRSLSRLKLPGTNLRGANFAASTLDRAYLQDADMTGAVFSGARMDSAFLLGACVEDADFSDARLENARFDNARAAGARFTGADCSGAHFRQADLRGVDFSDSVLDRCIFREADLRGARFNGARLDKAYFVGSRIDPGALDAAASRVALTC